MKSSVFNFQFSTVSRVFRSRGAISLAATIILGGVVLEIVVASSVLVYLVNSGSLGARLSEEALLAARSGINELLLKTSRDKDFVQSATTTIAISNSTSVSVWSCQSCGDPPVLGRNHLYSLGHAFTKRRFLVAVVEVDRFGLLTILSIEERPL